MKTLEIDDYADRVLKGERAALAQAITLVESVHPRHQELSEKLIEKLMPETGNAKRIGVTGVPGAGKSTFLEALGLYLVAGGLKVAILAIDPSSPVSGGSILGDKTRMTELARAESAFIRPTPSGDHHGGVGRRTREAMLVCEAAGFDVVIVETVGIGQSEFEVAHLVDCLLTLQIAGAGDDLQCVKKGLMEMVDLLVINKDDGENHSRVLVAQRFMESSLHILQRKYSWWPVPVLTASAIENRGISEVWQTVEDFWQKLSTSGELAALRLKQYQTWMNAQIKESALSAIFDRTDVQDCRLAARNALEEGRLSPKAGINAVTQFIRQLLKPQEIPMSSYKYVNVTINEKVAVIEFNYREKLNSLSKIFVDDLIAAFTDLNTPDVRCVILRAPKGSRIFSAGHDIKELPQEGHRDPLSYNDPLRQIVRIIQKFPKPVITLIEGSVWGGAFELVMSTDIIIASKTSTFAMTPVNLGVAYNLVGTHNLTRDAGMHFIKEMLFTAAPVSANRALEAGLINYALEAEELDEFTLNMARNIAAKAPLSIALLKEELRMLAGGGVMNDDDFERIQGLRRTAYDSDDFQEGLKAFSEKRKPNFQGR